MTPELTHNQKRWLGYMVKGMGLSAAKKEFNQKERKEMQQLLEFDLVVIGKNHSNDKIGMYYIKDENIESVKQLLSKES